ncbi:MAG: XRE family transcriptional regulator [Brevundimonas sp.]|nr:MAG: XRE family transcriptional regulator [Brevundimonas sp.]
MDMRRLVGENVRRFRLAANLTQEQLAERAGFTQQYVSELENGKQNPTAVTLFELAQQLGCEPADLVSRPKSP